MPDYNFVLPTGVVVPDTGDLQADVIAEFRSSFGQDLRVSADTPQGVLITAEALARAEVAENNATLANQINPDLAGGIFLDAIAALFALERQAATSTLVPGAVLGGRPMTIVPQGVRVRSSAGDLFRTAGAVILDTLGTATVNLLSVETGPVPAGAGSITFIVDPVLGWETVTNPVDGIAGTVQQSDESFRNLRRRTLARQGISTPEAIMSEVSALPNVRSLQFRENISNLPQTIDGIAMVPHSIWVCVDGGVDSDIALALLENKTAGAAWNGSTSVTVTEPSSGQVYTVLFERPEEVNVLVRVTLRRSNSTVDAVQAVPAAVLDYANGLMDGEQGFVVGGNVSPFELSGAINRQYPTLFVALVEVAPASTGVFQSTELVLAIDQVARVQASSVTVVQL